MTKPQLSIEAIKDIRKKLKKGKMTKKAAKYHARRLYAFAAQDLMEDNAIIDDYPFPDPIAYNTPRTPKADDVRVRFTLTVEVKKPLDLNGDVIITVEDKRRPLYRGADRGDIYTIGQETVIMRKIDLINSVRTN